MLIFQCLQISVLYISDKLNPFAIKMIKKSGELKCRTVNIRNFYFPLCHIDIRSKISKFHLLYDFC